MKPLLLIIDDDQNFINDLSLLLEQKFTCVSATSGTAGIKQIKVKTPDVVLLDLMFDTGENGIEILKSIKAADPNLPVLMITDYASVNTAIEAIKLGAYDYISKTPNLSELTLTIEQSLKQRLEKFRQKGLAETIIGNYKSIVGTSPATLALKEKISLYAQTENTVLITGESGVGKELVARQIHELSPRKDKPFLAVNCAALPKDLIESELFGHERGAFTGALARKPGKFELAENGTIFLDEVSEIDLESQVKLLRVLQEREFERVGGTVTITSRARLIAATNRNLSQLVQMGVFRKDLFYRLDVLQLNVPPLRERKDDIEDLVKHFIIQSSIDMKSEPQDFPEILLEDFMNYDWPGNIRELQNNVTRFMILPEGQFIGPTNNSAASASNEISKIPETWEEMDKLRREAAEKASRKVEERFLRALLKKFDGNVTKAAEQIGINRSNLHKMIRKCGLSESK